MADLLDLSPNMNDFYNEKAAELLLSTTDNISDIERLLGFSNHTHFYKIFIDYYGITPADYRRSYSK